MVLEPELARAREEAARLLSNGDPRGAFSRIRALLAHPSPLADDDAWRDSLTTFRDVVKVIAGDELSALVDAAVKDPNDVDALGELGYQLYEQDLHDVAAALLARAHALAPKSAAILSELVANLEAMTANDAAVQFLRGAPEVVERDAVLRYLLGFNAVMCGDLATARSVLPALKSSDDERVEPMTEALEGMLVRADAIAKLTPLDDRDLRGWHLALNGSLLLHRSPHGLDEPMRGRYAYVNDSFAVCRAAIDRVALVLRAAFAAPVEVITFPDRSSRILAEATARVLELPLGELRRSSLDGPCLVVAYDLDRVGDANALAALEEHRPGQVLFAHASSWTRPFPYAPDLTTFLYEQNVAPWDGGRLRVNPETRVVESSDEDVRPESIVAQDIVAATPSDDVIEEGGDALIELLRAVREVGGSHAPGLFRTRGSRARQRTGSPVKSARWA